MQELEGETEEEEQGAVGPELPDYTKSIEELFDKYEVPQPSLDDLNKKSDSQSMESGSLGAEVAKKEVIM